MSLPAGPTELPARCACLVVLDGWGLAEAGPGTGDGPGVNLATAHAHQAFGRGTQQRERRQVGVDGEWRRIGAPQALVQQRGIRVPRKLQPPAARQVGLVDIATRNVLLRAQHRRTKYARILLRSRARLQSARRRDRGRRWQRLQQSLNLSPRRNGIGFGHELAACRRVVIHQRCGHTYRHGAHGIRGQLR